MTRIVLQYVLSVFDNVLACLVDGTANDSLQLPLGSGVVGLQLSQRLLVLLNACYYDSTLCHTQTLRNSAVGLPMDTKKRQPSEVALIDMVG